MDNQEPNKQNNNRNNKNGQVVMTFIMVTLVALFIMSIVSNKVTQQFNQEISYTEFLEKVESGEVESVKFTGAQINITQKAKKESRFKPTYYTGLVNDYEMIELLKKHKVEIFGYIPDNTSTWIYNILSFVIPLALVWILLVFLMKRMGGGGYGRWQDDGQSLCRKIDGRDLFRRCGAGRSERIFAGSRGFSA